MSCPRRLPRLEGTEPCLREHGGVWRRAGIIWRRRRVEELETQYMSADLLPMLGVQPLRGRFFTVAEGLPDAPNVVLISYRLWQGWFGGDESVIGRKIQVSSTPATVIGVMPPGFLLPRSQRGLVGSRGTGPARDYRKTAGRYLMSVARLKPESHAIWPRRK